MYEKVNAIDTSRLNQKSDYDAKINEIKGEIPSITGLATTTALNAIKNEIPDVSDQAKKIDNDAKYQILSLCILPHLIIMNLRIIYLMLR